jgi:hypothetical protein
VEKPTRRRGEEIVRTIVFFLKEKERFEINVMRARTEKL